MPHGYWVRCYELNSKALIIPTIPTIPTFWRMGRWEIVNVGMVGIRGRLDTMVSKKPTRQQAAPWRRVRRGGEAVAEPSSRHRRSGQGRGDQVEGHGLGARR